MKDDLETNNINKEWLENHDREVQHKAYDDFASKLLKCDVVDKSVVRRILIQIKE